MLYAQPHGLARALRFTDLMLLVVPGSRLITKGVKAFSVEAPKMVNSFPTPVEGEQTLEEFKGRLNIFLVLKSVNAASFSLYFTLNLPFALQCFL